MNTGRFGIHGNLLYNLTTEGSRDTEIGDAFFYNLGIVYTLSTDDHAGAGHHDHSHIKWDIMLELNGEYRKKNEIDGDSDDNTGGDIIYLSPGVRVSSAANWSLFLSAGIPVHDDMNGRQTDTDYRVVGGAGFAF